MNESLTADSTASFAGGPPVPVELTQESEDIWVRFDRAVQPDPDWLYEDSHGHLHIWTGIDEGSATVPSCVVREEPCDGACGDPTHTWSVEYCADCGDRVKPGYRPDWKARAGKSIRGPMTITLSTWQLPMRDLGSLDRVRVVVTFPDGAEWAGIARWSGDFSMDSDGNLRRPLEFDFRPETDDPVAVEDNEERP